MRSFQNKVANKTFQFGLRTFYFGAPWQLLVALINGGATTAGRIPAACCLDDLTCVGAELATIVGIEYFKNPYTFENFRILAT